MSLFGFDNRLDEGSYAEDQADLQTGYAGEVWYAQGHRSGPYPVHHRKQAQTPRDIVEDGAEDCGSLEDEPGQIQTPGGKHLHEAGTGVAVDVDVFTISQGYVAGKPALDLCGDNHNGAGDHIGNGIVKYDRNEWIMDLIGIALMALIVIWALS